MNGLAIDGGDNVTDLKTCDFSGSAGLNIYHDHASAHGELEAFGQSGSNGGRRGADLAAIDVTESPQLIDHKGHNARRNGKAKSFTTSSGGDDEGVDADHVAIYVNERAAAVAWIDGSVSLDEHHRKFGIRLPVHRADYSHGNRITKAFRISQCKRDLALVNGMFRVNR